MNPKGKLGGNVTLHPVNASESSTVDDKDRAKCSRQKLLGKLGGNVTLHPVNASESSTIDASDRAKYSRQKLLGKLGEDYAAKFLETKGYSIVARNFRIRSAEIDIIAQLDGVIVFVEVKARSNTRHGLPKEAVTSRKQKKIIEAASVFLQDETFSECACRFDVMEVYLRGEFVEAINHIENAFEVI